IFKEIGDAYCAANAALGIPFYFGFPNERHRAIGERLLGYRSVERAGQLGRALPLPPARRGLLAQLLRPRVSVRRVEDVSSGHDALAEALHARAGWRPDRSRAVV